MFPDVGLTPDPPAVVFRHVLRMLPESDHDMVHLHYLPDGYNCDKDGLAVVIAEDASQADQTGHSRDLVRVSVYGPEHMMVRRLGRQLYAALTQGVTGVGLGVDRTRSTFFGSGPSFKPTGFVSTASISCGFSKYFPKL